MRPAAVEPGLVDNKLSEFVEPGLVDANVADSPTVAAVHGLTCEAADPPLFIGSRTVCKPKLQTATECWFAACFPSEQLRESWAARKPHMAAGTDAPLPNFRAVVGETDRNRVMDQTIRACLCPTENKKTPWQEYMRPPQLMRVQGQSKYVALRAVSTELLRNDRVQLPLLVSDASLRGPGTAGVPTPRTTFMANSMEQIQGGKRPMGSSTDLEHFHRFNRSTTCLLLRRGVSKTPTVQMEYILNKKPPMLEQDITVEMLAPVMKFAVSAFQRKMSSSASRAPSGEVYIYTYMYKCIYVSMYIYICIHICINVHICISPERRPARPFYGSHPVWRKLFRSGEFGWGHLSTCVFAVSQNPIFWCWQVRVRLQDTPPKYPAPKYL